MFHKIKSGMFDKIQSLIPIDKQKILSAMDTQSHSALEKASPKLKGDKEFMLTAVSKRGLALQYADDTLTADREVVLAAVAQSGPALEYADDILKADKEVVLAAVNKDGNVLKHASAALKADTEVVHTANANIEKYMSPMRQEVLKDVKSAKQAEAKAGRYGVILKNYSNSVAHVLRDNPLFRADKTVVLAVVEYDGLALQYADDTLKKDKDVAIAAVAQNPNALHYVDAALKNDQGTELN